jgi:hypothetical protein
VCSLKVGVSIQAFRVLAGTLIRVEEGLTSPANKPSGTGWPVPPAHIGTGKQSIKISRSRSALLLLVSQLFLSILFSWSLSFLWLQSGDDPGLNCARYNDSNRILGVKSNRPKRKIRGKNHRYPDLQAESRPTQF